MEVKEKEVNFENWLRIYNAYLEDGFKVCLRTQKVNGKQKLFIVYWL